MLKSLIMPLLKKYYKLFLGISIALALSMALLFGFNSACDTTSKSIDTFTSEYRYPDITITTELIEQSDIDKLASIKDIKNVNSRLTFYEKGKLENNKYINVRFITYNNRDFSLRHVYEINESDKYPNVLVNNSFLINNNIKVGDLLEVEINGENKTLCFGEAITTPDCVSIVINEYIYGNNPDIAYVYVPEEYLIDTEYENKYNQILIYAEDWADQKKIIKDVEKILADKVIDATLYEDSIVKERIERNLLPIQNLSSLLPAVFFGIVICVATLFLSQIIKQSRKDIGILRTLGFHVKDIRKLFSVIILITNVLSIILGTLLGIGLTVMVSNIYANVFNIPYVCYSYNIKYYIISIIAVLLSGQLAVLISINQIKSISPEEAITPQNKSLSNLDKKINNRFSKFDSKVKYSLSSILKNKKRFIFSTLCLTASVVLVFSSWAFYDSKNEIVNSLFNERIKFDYQYFCGDKLSDEELKLISETEEIENYEKLDYLKTTISFNNKERNIKIRGIESNTKMIGLYKYKSSLDSIGDGVIIEKHIAESIGAKIGDTVKINNKDFLVEGMVNEYVDRYCYVKNSNLENIGEITDYSIILCSDNEEAVVDLANKIENISLISSIPSMKKGMDSEFKLYDIATYLIIFFALIIGFIIIYNTTLTSLYEQRKELSVLRTIGFQVKDISKMWFIQTGLQTLISLVLGLLCGSIFAKFALSKVTTSTREYPFTVNPGQYLLTIIIVIVFVTFTHFVTMSCIHKWNLVENIKEKD